MGTTKVAVNMENELLEQVEAYAAKLHISRTAAVMVLLTKGLEQVRAIDSVTDLVKMMQEFKDMGLLQAPPVGSVE